MEASRWLHLTAVAIWVGGMFFAYMALRPAASKLEPALRLPLWGASLSHFFRWVWLSVVLILFTGLHMFFTLGGFIGAPRRVHIMFGLGVLMMLIFGHVYFSPYRRLKRYVALKDWPQAGAALNQIRRLVATNLLIGMVIIAVATLGRAML